MLSAFGKMPQAVQAPSSPEITESELLDLLATLDSDMDVGLEGGDQDVKMEEQSSVWEPSVSVVLDGGIFASEKDLESFMTSLTANEDNTGAMPNKAEVGGKRTSTQMTQVALPARGAKRKCRRTTRKQEIDRLRAVAAELERKLRALNQAHSLDKPDATHFWKNVSHRLFEQRQHATAENVRLRALVREQMTTAQALQHSLEKTPALSQGDVYPTTGENAIVCHEPAPKELYQDLFRNLSTLYSSGVDTMLPPTGVPRPSPEGNKKVNIEIETDSSAGLRMCLQVMENKLVPFSFDNIRDRAWKILTGTNGHKDFQLSVENQGDEMFGWCKLDNAMSSVQLLGNIAVRQYVEANKLTIMWECEGDVHQGASKTRIQPKGWCIFEPAEEDPLSTTIFRRCAILSPHGHDDLNTERSIGATTEAVLENYKQTVVYIFDGMLAALNNS